MRWVVHARIAIKLSRTSIGINVQSLKLLLLKHKKARAQASQVQVHGTHTPSISSYYFLTSISFIRANFSPTTSVLPRIVTWASFSPFALVTCSTKSS